MKIFSVGIVGAGLITRNTHLPVLLNMPNVRVAWLADSAGERARSLAQAYGVPQAVAGSDPDGLPACDVVLLAIPVGFREPYYRALAKRGAAVFGEKPFARNKEQHREMAALFTPDRVGCGFMRRMYDAVQQLRLAVAMGGFGRPLRMRIAEGGRSTKSGADRSHYDDVSAAGGGVLMTQGCHSLDSALFVTQAAGFKVLQKNIVWDGAIDRKAEAKIRLEHCSPAGDWACELDYCVSWLDRQENVWEIEFERARLSLGLNPEASLTLRDAQGRKLGTWSSARPGARTSNQAFFLEWKSFLQGVEEGRPSEISAESAQLTAALVDEIYRKESDSCA